MKENVNQVVQNKSTSSANNSGFETSGISLHAPAYQLKESNDEPIDDGASQSPHENIFNHDFSNVHIHTNSKKASDLNARAFTQGNEIHFANGEYNPSTKSGKTLLGHELTHVVQQFKGQVNPTTQKLGADINDDEGLETEADIMGDKFANHPGGLPNFILNEKASISLSNETKQRKVIQRFHSMEHSDIGNSGSGTAKYTIDNTGYPVKFELTHGDLVMLSGDFFDPRDTLDDGSANPDALFPLINKPSSDPGQLVGTQDEIIYAIYKINNNDSRFQLGGIWQNFSRSIMFSENVISTVNNRYLNLAAGNVEHFVSPNDIEAAPESGMRNSAGGSYRALHEEAILEAYKTGKSGGNPQMAYMREGAAQHFLTDYFASGHTRTPRVSINKYWGNKYPNFWTNLRKKIALDMAIFILDSFIFEITSVSTIYSAIISKVMKQTVEIPEIGFGDMVSMVAHDFDNEHGLNVINDRKEEWKTFGDSYLEHGSKTANMASESVKYGLMDLKKAFSLGREAGDFISDDQILENVRISGQFIDNGKYAPEQLLPHLKDGENGKQNWQVDSMESLWNTKVREDFDQTYGDLLKISVNSGEMAHQMSDMAKKFPVIEFGMVIVFPQSAFLKGFLEPLKTNTYKEMLNMIHWDPSKGRNFLNKDDAVVENHENTNFEEKKGLTMEQRVTRINNLLDGSTVLEEEEVIIELFATCDFSNRKDLYFMIEGRKWRGQFKYVPYERNERLYNDLSFDNLQKVQNLINKE